MDIKERQFNLDVIELIKKYGLVSVGVKSILIRCCVNQKPTIDVEYIIADDKKEK